MWRLKSWNAGFEAFFIIIASDKAGNDVFEIQISQSLVLNYGSLSWTRDLKPDSRRFVLRLWPVEQYLGLLYSGRSSGYGYSFSLIIDFLSNFLKFYPQIAILGRTWILRDLRTSEPPTSDSRTKVADNVQGLRFVELLQVRLNIVPKTVWINFFLTWGLCSVKFIAHNEDRRLQQQTFYWMTISLQEIQELQAPPEALRTATNLPTEQS